MTSLTEDARGDLEYYMRQVRTALRGHRSIDPVEVERDVREHVDAELSSLPEPIDARSLRFVLERLGPPDTWLPAEDLPAWRRVLEGLRSGPEDWRLAYLSFGLSVLGPVLFLVGPVLWPLPLVLIVAGVLTARASLALLAAHNEAVGARRWLLHPPLVLGYLGLGIGLLAWPLPLVGGALTDDPAARARLAAAAANVPGMAMAAAAGAFGVWLLALGLALRRFGKAVRTVFWPFADGFDCRHATRLALTGLFILAVSGNRRLGPARAGPDRLKAGLCGGRVTARGPGVRASAIHLGLFDLHDLVRLDVLELGRGPVGPAHLHGVHLLLPSPGRNAGACRPGTDSSSRSGPAASACACPPSR